MARRDQIFDEAQAVRAIRVVGDEDMTQLPRRQDAEGKEAQGVQVDLLCTTQGWVKLRPCQQQPLPLQKQHSKHSTLF